MWKYKFPETINERRKNYTRKVNCIFLIIIFKTNLFNTLLIRMSKEYSYRNNSSLVEMYANACSWEYMQAYIKYVKGDKIPGYFIFLTIRTLTTGIKKLNALCMFVVDQISL